MKHGGADIRPGRRGKGLPQRPHALRAALSTALSGVLALGALGSAPFSAVQQALADAEFSSGELSYRVLDADAHTVEVSGPADATARSIDIPREVESGDVSYQVVAIGASAFKGDTALAAVNIEGSLTGGGIKESAFEDCTALEEVSFQEDAELATASIYKDAGLGRRAFAGCTALKSITVPAITSAARKADAYESFSELNPGNTYFNTSESFLSGRAPYWHNSEGPVARWGMGEGVFDGCTALETVVFADGNPTGAFAYWTAGSNVFTGCTSLKSLVFEGQRAYWGNPQTSMQNSSYTNIWSSDYNAIDEPTAYLTVSYRSVDGSLLARVAYKEGTSTSDIETGSVDADAVYGDAVVPEPTTGKVWKLDSTQSRREGLTDSCNAYLADADDLGAGRLSASQVTALYLQADRNLSEPTEESGGSVFDPKRYAAGGQNYRMTPIDTEDTPYFTFDATKGTLDSELAAYDASGTKVASTVDAENYPCTMSFRAVNASESAETIDTPGAYLVTVRPRNGESGHSGTFTEWILVRSRNGKVAERFGETPAATQSAALEDADFSDAPYSVSVGTKDVAGALVASGYAGLVRTGILYDADGTSGAYGFKINRGTYKNGTVRDASRTRSFSRAASGGKTPAADTWAVAVYDRFAEDWQDAYRGDSSAETPPWGDTAVLVPAAHASELASASAYAYAHRAPVFFTKSDGTLGSSTASRLKGFDKVVVFGTADQFSEARFSDLEATLGTGTAVTRLAGSDATPAALSTAIARSLVEDSLSTYATATVSDSYDPMDCVLALSLSGKEGGVTFSTGSTDETKTIAQLLHDRNADVNDVELYGREGTSNTTHLMSTSYEGNVFSAIWESDEDFATALRGVTQNPAHPKNETSPSNNKKKNAGKKNTSKKKGASSTKKAKRSQAAAKAATRHSPAGSSSASVNNNEVAPPVDYTIDDSDDSGETTAKKTKAASSKSASTDATAQQAAATTQQDTQSDAEQASSSPVPWWAQAAFAAIIIAVCAAVVPILRRCR